VCVCVCVCISRNDFLFFLFAESPAEFFAENKNIAGFDNVSFIYLIFEKFCRFFFFLIDVEQFLC